jgi:hypothetical protein
MTMNTINHPDGIFDPEAGTFKRNGRGENLDGKVIKRQYLTDSQGFQYDSIVVQFRDFSQGYVLSKTNLNEK